MSENRLAKARRNVVRESPAKYRRIGRSVMTSQQYPIWLAHRGRADRRARSPVFAKRLKSGLLDPIQVGECPYQRGKCQRFGGAAEIKTPHEEFIEGTLGGGGVLRRRKAQHDRRCLDREQQCDNRKRGGTV